ncbi:MAG: exodeoxyribonuclease V subunit beta, partial [Desulfobacterales bacterium]
KHFYTALPELVANAMPKMNGPEYFADLINQINSPQVSVVPSLDAPEFTEVDSYRHHLDLLRADWSKSRNAIRERLIDPGLSATVYGSLKPDPLYPGQTRRDLKINAFMKAMDRLLDSQNVGFPPFKNFVNFTSTKLKTSTKKNHIPPAHPFFKTCDTLYRLGGELKKKFDIYLTFLKTESGEYARYEAAQRKKEHNIQFFEDLLTKIKAALQGQSGNKLVRSIRKRYQAALVDEFQDTDPIQYEIFSKLFDSRKTILFLIGDPKQAIYSFRGADIFSYIEAARKADSKYTLIDNWRTKPGLIRAVNTLFSNVKTPFVFSDIHFTPGRSGFPAKSESKTDAAPFRLWYLSALDHGMLNKKNTVAAIASAVADEVARLVLTAKRFYPQDIAILVRTNRQAQIMKNHLQLNQIPAVIFNAGNVLESREATSMGRILSAICEPTNERKLRNALTTDVLGVSGDVLYAADQQPWWWAERHENFREYFRLWGRYGFMRMFQFLLSHEKVRNRLLSFPNGERRLTNLLHLAEILHQKSMNNRLGKKGLLKWFKTLRNPATQRIEEYQLRLESDAKAVKIVTIHKSKGLEYEVVFCPFAWDGGLRKTGNVWFHDADAQMRLTLDVGSAQRDLHLKIAQKELLAENLRLLYVALTRAKTRCYLIWGPVKNSATSALAYLLHGGGERFADHDIIESWQATFGAKNEKNLLSDLVALGQKSGGSITVSPIRFKKRPADPLRQEKDKKLTLRRFRGSIDKHWKVTSYSALVDTQERRPEFGFESFDYDRYNQPWFGSTQHFIDRYDSAPALKADVSRGIFSFPKGRRAGIFFHDIFEHLDFKCDLEKQGRLVKDKLAQHGFGDQWFDPVFQMLKNVLCVPLMTTPHKLTLADIAKHQRITEMEFYYPLNRIRPGELKEIFKKFANIRIRKDFADSLEELTFSPSEGFMKGYIDLIFQFKNRFYLLDWKSNFLGDGIEHYHLRKLRKTMVQEFYFLQYHLYTLALYQYLRQHKSDFQYNSDFGGVFYIFMRGVDPQFGPEFGIYHDIPKIDLINALGSALIPAFDRISNFTAPTASDAVPHRRL